jgi:hypothetical protein
VTAARLVHPRGRRDTTRVDGVTSTTVELELRLGQTVTISAGHGVMLAVERFESGAVTVRNVLSRKVLRAWAPKEAQRNE